MCEASAHTPASGGGPVLGTARHRGRCPAMGDTCCLPGSRWRLVSHLHSAAQGASLAAGLAAGGGRRRQWDSKNQLFSRWRSSSSSRWGICAEAAAAVAAGAAQRQPKVFWPCCEPGGVCVLVLSDPRLPPCYPIPLLSV